MQYDLTTIKSMLDRVNTRLGKDMKLVRTSNTLSGQYRLYLVEQLNTSDSEIKFRERLTDQMNKQEMGRFLTALCNILQA